MQSEMKIDDKNIPVRKAEKTPRQKQEERRFFCTVFMAVCVLFLAGWSVCQMIKNINSGAQVISLSGQPNEVVEDNSQNEGKKIDVNKLAEKVLNNVSFDVELNKLSDSVAEGMISTTEGTSLQVYIGNGAYADELIIMTALNEEDAKTNQENVETHIREIRKQFNDYKPDQVKKIDNAVQIRSGCYVIVCVTSDADTAKKTIEAFMKQ